MFYVKTNTYFQSATNILCVLLRRAFDQIPNPATEHTAVEHELFYIERRLTNQKPLRAKNSSANRAAESYVYFFTRQTIIILLKMNDCTIQGSLSVLKYNVFINTFVSISIDAYNHGNVWRPPIFSTK